MVEEYKMEHARVSASEELPENVFGIAGGVPETLRTAKACCTCCTRSLRTNASLQSFLPIPVIDLALLLVLQNYDRVSKKLKDEQFSLNLPS